MPLTKESLMLIGARQKFLFYVMKNKYEYTNRTKTKILMKIDGRDFVGKK